MSPLEQLQSDLFFRAGAADYYSDIGLYLFRPREDGGFVQIQSKVDQVLNGLVKKSGKTGIAISFLMPLADAKDPDAPGPRLHYAVVARVQEMPVINMGPTGTGKSAEEVALNLLSLCHHFNPGNGSTVVAANDAVTPSDAFDPKITLDVKFTIESGLAPCAKVSAPTIAPKSGAHSQLVTMTCATPGAVIRYTIDGSSPVSANPAAVIYTAPFTPAAAGLIRAGAELAATNPSDITRALFT